MMVKEPDGSKKHLFRPINARYQTLKEDHTQPLER